MRSQNEKEYQNDLGEDTKAGKVVHLLPPLENATMTARVDEIVIEIETMTETRTATEIGKETERGKGIVIDAVAVLGEETTVTEGMIREANTATIEEIETETGRRSATVTVKEIEIGLETGIENESAITTEGQVTKDETGRETKEKEIATEIGTETEILTDIDLNASCEGLIFIVSLRSRPLNNRDVSSYRQQDFWLKKPPIPNRDTPILSSHPVRIELYP